MPRPRPTRVYHFTHVDHLRTSVTDGLLSDTRARQTTRTVTDVGNQGIKARRSRRAVPVGPGGVVADYAPFYFAPRSPMMFAIEHGNVPTYSSGCDELIYLVTTVEKLRENGARLVFTDRNAAQGVAKFTDDLQLLDELVDWPLVQARMWNDTTEHPDRRERRMAECLVHERASWDAFTGIAAKVKATADAAGATLGTAGSTTEIHVVPGWYF